MFLYSPDEDFVPENTTWKYEKIRFQNETRLKLKLYHFFLACKKNIRSHDVSEFNSLFNDLNFDTESPLARSKVTLDQG